VTTPTAGGNAARILKFVLSAHFIFNVSKARAKSSRLQFYYSLCRHQATKIDRKIF